MNNNESKNLYLASSTFNRNRIIERLAVLVENAGGRVKYTRDPDVDVVINTRGFFEHIQKAEERVDFWKKYLNSASPEKQEKIKNAINNAVSELEELKKEDENALSYISNFCGKYSWGLPSLHFVLDNYYYAFSFDDNPFCVDHYEKIKIDEKNSYIGMYYFEALTDDEKEPKGYIFDSLFQPVAPDDDIKEAAAIIFNRLQLANCSSRYYERKKTRVQNTYDGGYHYEYIPGKNDNKITVIDF